MVRVTRWNVGQRHAAVALAYALAYLLLREVSWSHWLLLAGLRVSVLMLVPYRYWPALVVGELGPTTYASLSCIDTFGWVWSSLMLIPPLAMAMPFIKFARDRLELIPGDGSFRMGALLSCTLVLSGVWTLAYVVTLFSARLASNAPPIDYATEASRWFIGNYLGILTVTPLTLMTWAARARFSTHRPSHLKQMLFSALAVEAVAFALPVLALFVWIAIEASSEESRSVARMLMFVPVVWLALRHGWQGAALGGTAASASVALTMPQLYDQTTLQAEVFVAFACSSMLLLGGRIAALRIQPPAHESVPDDRLKLARRIQAQCESQLRHSALGIKRISDAIYATEELLADPTNRRRFHLDACELRKRAETTREELFELVDGLRPTAHRGRGLESELRSGSIARALHASGIGYWCRLRGNFQNLSDDFQLALHRVVRESVTHLCSEHGVADFSVQLRSADRFGYRWAYVRINARLASHQAPQVVRLLQQLAATGLGMEAICDRAALYEGKACERHAAGRSCITVLMREPQPKLERVAPVARATHVIVSF